MHCPAFRARAAAGLAALATVAIGAASLPAVAAAKSPKPLTKSQVIKLIKQYGSPGPRGATGPPGPRGNAGPSWTLASGSELTLSPTNALGINFAGIAGCGGYEFLTAVKPSGSSVCRLEPTSDLYSGTGGFSSGSAGATTPPLGEVIGADYNNVVHNSPAVGQAGPHLVTASIQLGATTPVQIFCELDQLNGNAMTTTPLQTEATYVIDYSTLFFQQLTNAKPGDYFNVMCKATGNGPTSNGTAGGSVFTYLVNN